MIEEHRRTVEALRERGIQALYGDIADASLLEHAGLQRAKVLVFAAYDPPAAEFAVEHAHAVNPRIEIVVRVETPEEARRLLDRGANQTVEGSVSSPCRWPDTPCAVSVSPAMRSRSSPRVCAARPEPAGAV